MDSSPQPPPDAGPARPFCAVCGSPLPRGNSLFGLCPRCLVVGALKETTDAADALEHVGKYELVCEIGRGGMGVVYQAMDSALHRPVALKLLPPGLLASRDATRRFFTEAQAAARLNHPNIVPIYEIGDGSQGQPFMAMEYVAGGTLAQRLKKGPLAPVVAAALLEKIARGIQHAHERGILHRDIKPGNILLKEGDEPLIADFGLARLLESDSSLTRTGAMLGTPSYLAPELVDGRGRESTTAAEVYSLGATLYECLAGRPPFVADTTPALVRKIAEEEPPRLRACFENRSVGLAAERGGWLRCSSVEDPRGIFSFVAPRHPPRRARNPFSDLFSKHALRKTDSSTTNSIVDRDLETICLKCLEKEPQKRYFSASALADDLARWRRGEPIEARPSAVAERIVKWARRRPAIAALTVSLLAVGLSGLTGVLLELRRALDGERAARLNEYAADMNVVNQALLSGDPGRARALLEQYIPKPGQPDLRRWEWNYFYSQANHDDSLATLGRQDAPIWWATFSPDGHWLATADLAGELRLWDVRARALAAQTRQPGPVSAIRFTADGRFLVSSSGTGFSTNGAIRWLTVPDFRQAREPMVISNLIQALPSPGGREWFIVGNGNFNRFASDGRTRLPAGSVPQKYPPAGFGVFSPDGSYFAYETGSASARRLAVWNLTQDTARIFSGHRWREGFPYTITGLAFTPDDSAVVSCGLDGAVRVWPLQPKSPNDSVRELRDIGGNVGEVAFALGGKLLAGGSIDETIHLWDAQTWNLAGQLRGSKSAVVALAVSPDGAMLASGAMDGEVKLWSASPPRARQTALPLPNYVFSTIDENLFLSPAGRYLLTRDKPRQAFQLWNTTTFELQTNVPAPPPEYPYPSAVGPDGRWLAFIGKQGTRLVPRDSSSGIAARTLTNAWIYQFSADGRWLLGLDGSLTAHIYDAENGSELARDSISDNGAWRNVTFSGNGEWIAIAFHGGHVWAWNWRAHRMLKIESRAATLISDVAFSPDGKQLATVSYDSLTRVYDLATGRERFHITASSFELDSVAWSPDGHRLVIGSNDGLVRLWDLDTTPVREIAVLPGHTNAVQAAAFAPDGTLVTVSRDSLRVWRTDQAAR